MSEIPARLARPWSAQDGAVLDAPGRPVRLSSGELHVWTASLRLPPEILRERGSILSAQEQAKADALALDRLADDYTASCILTRYILGRYLGVAASEVRFRHGVEGKPGIESDGADVRLRFNLAHSGGLALLAVSPDRAIGVDLEWMDPALDHDAIAATMLGPADLGAYGGLSPNDRREFFFRCWTRREALTKARGLGLGDVLRADSVGGERWEGGASLRWRDPLAAAGRDWIILDLEMEESHAAALAWEAGAAELKRIQRFRFDPIAL